MLKIVDIHKGQNWSNLYCPGNTHNLFSAVPTMLHVYLKIPCLVLTSAVTFTSMQAFILRKHKNTDRDNVYFCRYYL